MDPQPEKSPGVALSQPSGERGVPMPGVGYHSPEMGPAPQETSFQPQTPTYGAVSMGQPVQAIPLPSPQPADPYAVAPISSAPMQPDESTNLDKEWVSRAKAIVAQTKTDPFLESRELGKAKAEFLRIKYNKHIKVAEEQR